MLHRSSFNSRGGTEEGAQFVDKCWQRRSSAVRSAIARRVDRIEDRSELRIAQVRAHFAQHKRLQSDRPVRPLGRSSCACAKHGPMQYGSTRCWCVLRRDCFASGRQLTPQPSAVTAQMRRLRASDCACGRSCISSIPIISSPSADTLSHKQRLNRACAHFARGHSLAVPSADGPQRRRPFRLSEATQLTVGRCGEALWALRLVSLGGSVWSPVRTANSRATECGGSKNMRSTDLCRNSGFCSDTARYSFSEIVPFLQKCTHKHMHAHTRARRDKRLYLSVSSSLMRFATTRSATSPPCACSAACCILRSFADRAPPRQSTPCLSATPRPAGFHRGRLEAVVRGSARPCAPTAGCARTIAANVCLACARARPWSQLP